MHGNFDVSLIGTTGVAQFSMGSFYNDAGVGHLWQPTTNFVIFSQFTSASYLACLDNHQKVDHCWLYTMRYATCPLVETMSYIKERV